MPFEILHNTSTNLINSIESILKFRKGSCTSKHFLLGLLYEKLYECNVEYDSYLFYWEDQDYLPKELKEYAKNVPTQFHLALEIEGKDIDATFDSKLAEYYFPVNEFDNCKISVEYIDKIPHNSPEERINYVIKNAPKNDNIRIFYQKFNNWLRKIRI